MYRLFFNNRCLTIVNFCDNLLTSENVEMSVNTDVVDNLMNKIKKWLLDNDAGDIVFDDVDANCMLVAIKSLFRMAPAAGGLVVSDNKIVAIMRNGIPDLPKGHIEKNESPDVAAIREVEEETGMRNLSIIRPLPSTWHCYLLDDKWVLKKTYWYLMSSLSPKDFRPQQEEGISSVFEIDKDNVHDFLRDTYPSIREVLGDNILEMVRRE